MCARARGGEGMLRAEHSRSAGEWRDDLQHGEGACRFADGTLFRGQWRASGWLQSAACPLRSTALLSPQEPHLAVAGCEASFTIQVICSSFGFNCKTVTELNS